MRVRGRADCPRKSCTSTPHEIGRANVPRESSLIIRHTRGFLDSFLLRIPRRDFLLHVQEADLDRNKGGTPANRAAFKPFRHLYCLAVGLVEDAAGTGRPDKIRDVQVMPASDLRTQYAAGRRARNCICTKCSSKSRGVSTGRGSARAPASDGGGSSGAVSDPPERGRARDRPESCQPTPERAGAEPHPRRRATRAGTRVAAMRELLPRHINPGADAGAAGTSGDEGPCEGEGGSACGAGPSTRGDPGPGPGASAAAAGTPGTGRAVSCTTCGEGRTPGTDGKYAPFRLAPGLGGRGVVLVEVFNEVVQERDHLKLQVGALESALADIAVSYEEVHADSVEDKARLHEALELVAELDAMLKDVTGGTPRHAPHDPLAGAQLDRMASDAAKFDLDRTWSTKTEMRGRETLLKAGLEALRDKRCSTDAAARARAAQKVREALHGLAKSGAEHDHLRAGLAAFVLDVVKGGESAATVAHRASVDFFKSLPRGGVVRPLARAPRRHGRGRHHVVQARPRHREGDPHEPPHRRAEEGRPPRVARDGDSWRHRGRRGRADEQPVRDPLQDYYRDGRPQARGGAHHVGGSMPVGQRPGIVQGGALWRGRHAGSRTQAPALAQRHGLGPGPLVPGRRAACASAVGARHPRQGSLPRRVPGRHQHRQRPPPPRPPVFLLLPSRAPHLRPGRAQEGHGAGRRPGVPA